MSVVLYDMDYFGQSLMLGREENNFFLKKKKK